MHSKIAEARTIGKKSWSLFDTLKFAIDSESTGTGNDLV